MERVAFLIEPEDVRISCLLNPETVVIKRTAGIKSRESIGGPLTGVNMSDAPLLFTGGGQTWIDLELLFDVHLPGGTLRTHDVRDLSGIFFKMAENSVEENGVFKPPVVRMVWGKSWNIPGVITHVAERLDCFSASGVPARSWLKLRMRRVPEDDAETPSLFDWLNDLETSLKIIDQLDQYAQTGLSAVSSFFDELSASVLFNERLDLLAQRFYGNPSLWRFIAAMNRITDPFAHGVTITLRIPPISELVKMI
jgi:hypothetical protein